MAPVPGLTREQVIERILQAKGPCRINMGSPHRDSVIIFDGQRWRMSPMRADPEVIQRESERRLGQGLSFMPEDVVDLQTERDPVLVHEDRDAFIELLRQFPWAFGGPQMS